MKLFGTTKYIKIHNRIIYCRYVIINPHIYRRKHSVLVYNPHQIVVLASHLSTQFVHIQVGYNVCVFTFTGEKPETYKQNYLIIKSETGYTQYIDPNTRELCSSTATSGLELGPRREYWRHVSLFASLLRSLSSISLIQNCAGSRTISSIYPSNTSFSRHTEDISIQE